MTAEDDWVEVYKGADGWRWRRQAQNGRIVSVSGEAMGKNDADESARRNNPDIEVKIIEPQEEA